MPVHDWTRVDAGAFHDFHSSWIIHLKEALNAGLLPADYYAQAEQHTGDFIADVLTLHVPKTHRDKSKGQPGGIALAKAAPQVKRKLSPSTAYRKLKRTLTIRHVSGNEVIALLEIVSPGNKDRARHVDQFVSKAEAAISQGIHLFIVDLFPPGAHDPLGLPPLLWDRFSADPYPHTQDDPLTITSCLADQPPDFYIEPFSVGDPLIDMPLFLNPDYYVNVPLEKTYLQAWHGMPAVHRQALELQ